MKRSPLKRKTPLRSGHTLYAKAVQAWSRWQHLTWREFCKSKGKPVTCMATGTLFNLQADHVDSKARHPEKRLDPMNGQIISSNVNRDKGSTFADYRTDEYREFQKLAAERDWIKDHHGWQRRNTDG